MKAGKRKEISIKASWKEELEGKTFLFRLTSNGRYGLVTVYEWVPKIKDYRIRHSIRLG